MIKTDDMHFIEPTIKYYYDTIYLSYSIVFIEMVTHSG